MVKRIDQHHSKSLKTFYLYAAVVFVFICIALLVKSFLLFHQSKFDHAHQFTLAVTKQGMVREVISFHPQTPALAILLIEDKSIPYDTLAKNYGISTDGYMQRDDRESFGSDVTGLLWSSLLRSAMLQTNLTVFDITRLMLLSKNVTTNNKAVDKIILTKQSMTKNALIVQSLTDQDIATENISIQIINATDVTGMGQRLGRVLTSLGANVVDISTAPHTQSKSTIAYFGDDSYTLQRLQKLLVIFPTKFNQQKIANIIITIGTDKQQTTAF